MAENMEKAMEVYGTLCRALDNRNWKYTKDDENLTVKVGIKAEPYNFSLRIRVKPKQEVVALYSILPFEISEDKRNAIALSACAANCTLLNGGFDFDTSDGSIKFRLVSSYKDSTLGEDLFNYMINVSGLTVKRYMERFLLVDRGIISVEKFIEMDRNS